MHTRPLRSPVPTHFGITEERSHGVRQRQRESVHSDKTAVRHVRRRMHWGVRTDSLDKGVLLRLQSKGRNNENNNHPQRRSKPRSPPLELRCTHRHSALANCQDGRFCMFDLKEQRRLARKTGQPEGALVNEGTRTGKGC